MVPLPPRGTPICLLADIPDGAGRVFSLSEVEPPLPLLILRSGESVFGYLNRCAHFGIPLANSDKQLLLTPHREIKCNVHYARYDWAEGHCLSGECAGDGLTSIALQIVNGTIQIG
jgi:nitrite reductase/ring-hydroxylating ferredoxin subunit